MATSKAVPGFFFVLFVSFLGLFAGTFVGATFFVPEGSGLAGPAIALGYGVVGLVVALVGGVLLARKLAPAKLRAALLITGLLALLAVAWLTYRFVTNRSGREVAPEPAVTVVRATRSWILDNELGSTSFWHDAMGPASRYDAFLVGHV